MNAQPESPPSAHTPSRLSFTIFAAMSVVMAALAVGTFIDKGKVTYTSGLLALGSVGAMIGCLSTRPKK